MVLERGGRSKTPACQHPPLVGRPALRVPVLALLPTHAQERPLGPLLVSLGQLEFVSLRPASEAVPVKCGGTARVGGAH